MIIGLSLHWELSVIYPFLHFDFRLNFQWHVRNSWLRLLGTPLNSGNDCYYYVQKLISPRRLKGSTKDQNTQNTLPVVLYDRETWYFTFTEGHKLQEFENEAFRKIFWLKMDDISEKFRILHNEKLSGLYRSSSVVTTVKLWWAGHVVRI